MPREILAAMEIAFWLENHWQGVFYWDEGNETKPLKRAHSCEDIENAFVDFVFVGEIKPFAGEIWGNLEKRFVMISQLNEKSFRITFTIRGEKIRYISHGRIR